MASEAEIEAAAKAIFLHRRGGPDPCWPVGINRNGHHCEPYVAYVPSWKWFYEVTARLALEAAEKVRPDPPPTVGGMEEE